LPGHVTTEATFTPLAISWGGLKPPASSVSGLAAARFGIIGGVDKPTLELGILAGASPGQPNTLGVTAHYGGDNLGVYAQYQALLKGGVYEDSTASLNVALGENLDRPSGQHSLYANAIFGLSSAGTIAGRDVQEPGSVSLLVGDLWNIHNGNHSIGAEGIVTGSGTPGLTTTSLRYGGDVSYVFGSGPTAVGIAAGLLNETNHGGFTAFINIGIGIDRTFKDVFHH
jgi:hypothetical protein